MNITQIKAATSKLPSPIFKLLKATWQSSRRIINRIYFGCMYSDVVVLDVINAKEGQLNQPIVIDYILKGAMRGFFLDIGANHPKTNSNTYFFEKQRGYSGIALDPLEQYKSEWENIRPNTLFMNIAAGSNHGEVLFFQHENTDGWADQLSFTEISRQGTKTDRAGKLVKMMPIADVEKLPHEITFASIDVEGAEHDVLKGFKQCVRPKVMVVENCFGPIGNNELRKQVALMGYKLTARISYIDDVFVRNDLLVNLPDLRQIVRKHPDLFR